MTSVLLSVNVSQRTSQAPPHPAPNTIKSSAWPSPITSPLPLEQSLLGGQSNGERSGPPIGSAKVACQVTVVLALACPAPASRTTNAAVATPRCRPITRETHRGPVENIGYHLSSDWSGPARPYSAA